MHFIKSLKSFYTRQHLFLADVEMQIQKENDYSWMISLCSSWSYFLNIRQITALLSSLTFAVILNFKCLQKDHTNRFLLQGCQNILSKLNCVPSCVTSFNSSSHTIKVILDLLIALWVWTMLMAEVLMLPQRCPHFNPKTYKYMLTYTAKGNLLL